MRVSDVGEYQLRLALMSLELTANAGILIKLQEVRPLDENPGSRWSLLGKEFLILIHTGH